MTLISSISIWIILWFGSWIIYNFFLIPKGYSYFSRKRTYIGIYYLGGIFSSLMIFSNYLQNLEVSYLFAISITILIHLLFVTLYISLDRNRGLIAWSVFSVKNIEIIFQQILITVGANIFSTSLSNNYMAGIIFGISFGIGHTIVLLAPMLTIKMRIFIASIAYIGGILFGLMILLVTFGSIYSYSIHLLFYAIFWIYRTKIGEFQKLIS